MVSASAADGGTDSVAVAVVAAVVGTMLLPLKAECCRPPLIPGVASLLPVAASVAVAAAASGLLDTSLAAPAPPPAPVAAAAVAASVPAAFAAASDVAVVAVEEDEEAAPEAAPAPPPLLPASGVPSVYKHHCVPCGRVRVVDSSTYTKRSAQLSSAEHAVRAYRLWPCHQV